MRPDVLFPLFAETTTLAGVGPRLGKLIAKLAGPRVVDLLWHLPSGLIDRRFAPKIAEAPADRIATITVTVGAHHPPHVKRQPYKVFCSDDTGTIELLGCQLGKHRVGEATQHEVDLLGAAVAALIAQPLAPDFDRFAHDRLQSRRTRTSHHR